MDGIKNMNTAYEFVGAAILSLAFIFYMLECVTLLDGPDPTPAWAMPGIFVITMFYVGIGFGAIYCGSYCVSYYIQHAIRLMGVSV